MIVKIENKDGDTWVEVRDRSGITRNMVGSNPCKVARYLGGVGGAAYALVAKIHTLPARDRYTVAAISLKAWVALSMGRPFNRTVQRSDVR